MRQTDSQSRPPRLRVWLAAGLLALASAACAAKDTPGDGPDGADPAVPGIGNSGSTPESGPQGAVPGEADTTNEDGGSAGEGRGDDAHGQ